MPFDVPAIADVVETVIKTALAPLLARVKALESRPPAELGDLRARIATLEATPPREGPPGPPGAPGMDGAGLEGYTVDYDGERTFTHTWRAGGATKELRITVPIPIYRGVFLEDKIYERGDFVTVSGSLYHCDEDTTTRPGEGSKAWTLAVKRGKDDRGGEKWPR
jgi:hypothetical protein